MWHTIVLNDQPHLFRIESEIPTVFDGPVDAEIRSSRVTVWLSDFRHIWLDSLTVDGLLERSKTDNDLLEYEERTVLDIVVRKANDELRADGAVVRLERSAEDTDLLWLRCKTYVSEMPFHFHWRLQRQSEDIFFTNVTKSLLANLLCTQRQCAQLLDVIGRKDAEIEQYKLAGAEIVRTHLITAKFDAPAFRQLNQLPADPFAQLLADTSSTTDVQRLAALCELPEVRNPLISSAESVPPPAPGTPRSKKRPAGQHLSPSQRQVRVQRIAHKFPVKSDVKMTYDDAEDCADDEAAANVVGCAPIATPVEVPADKPLTITTTTRSPKKFRTKLNL